MWWSVAAWSAPAPDGPGPVGTRCDPNAATALVEQLARVPADRRLVAAASAWGPLCAGDGVLDAQLAQIATARAEDRWLVELQTSLLDPRGWWRACGTATSSEAATALSMATKLDPERRRGHLWDRCLLDRFAAFERDEWAGSTGMIVLPLLAASALRDGAVPDTAARPIVRALAGLP